MMGSSIKGARTALVKVEWTEPMLREAWRALALRSIVLRFVQRDWPRFTETEDYWHRRVTL